MSHFIHLAYEKGAVITTTSSFKGLKKQQQCDTSYPFFCFVFIRIIEKYRMGAILWYQGDLYFC